jgi:peptidoglycan/xylan/chitin deacetylase (PgdA/CDA1 family)
LRKILLLVILLCFLSPGNRALLHSQERASRERILSLFSGKIPRQWGQKVKGVKTRLRTEEKVVALTFDACGGPKRSKGNGYDAKLIEYLKEAKVPATLFISGRWIDANRDIFQNLAGDPLFEIENHGLNHKPCSVNGRSIYGIKGTRTVGELIDEIEQNGLNIQILAGRKPRFYRPAAAYCDDVGEEVAKALGYEVVTFSVLGDGGATYAKPLVRETLLNAPPSSIILMHMNHPEGETAEGVIEAIPELRKQGFRFVKLLDYDLR